MKAPVAHDGYVGVAKRLALWLLLMSAAGAVLCFLTNGVIALLLEGHDLSDRAELDIKNIHAALVVYRKKNGDWPPEQGWIAALVEAKLVEREPFDPWDQPYGYRLVIADGGVAPPQVTSVGRDGVAGTDDDLPRRATTR